MIRWLGLGRHTGVWLAIVAAFLLCAVQCAKAWADDLRDFPEADTDASEDGRAFHAGAQDAIGVWVVLDCRGLTTAALSRCEAATKGDVGDNPSTLVRLVARIGQEAAGGGWVKHATAPVYLAYGVPTRPVYRRLKWYSQKGPQAARFQVFAATWAQVRGHVQCPSFFPPYALVDPETGLSLSEVIPCDRNSPPVVFAGVTP